MNSEFVDSLDSALQKLQDGEEITAVIHAYPSQADHLEPLLVSAKLLTLCEPVIMPSAEDLLADQHQFTNQMALLLPPAVSSSFLIRLSNWMVNLFSGLKFRPKRANKERNQMGALLLKAILILTILFGSVGGTAVMAAESLPNSPLYPTKMMVETIRLNLATDDIAQAETHIDIAGERLHEVERLMVDGNMVDIVLLQRAETHLESAFRLAADMPVPAMAGVLVKAQEMVQTRIRALADVEAQIPAEAEPTVKQVQQMLKNAGETAVAGLQDPQVLRHRYTTNRPDHAPAQPEQDPPAIIITPTQPITTPVPIEPLGPCATGNEACDPQREEPYGPQPDAPREGPGSGLPNDVPPVTPAPPGPPEDRGADNEHGNSDSGCVDCNQGEQNGYGAQPEESGNGSGTPGGSDEGMPIGGQSQNGSQYQEPETNLSPPDDLLAGNPATVQNNDDNGKK